MTDLAATGTLRHSHIRILAFLHELGGAARTVELSPYSMLRKAGVAATPAGAATVHADLAMLEATGHLLLGERTASGIMVMLLTCSDLPVLLTCQRLVTMYGWLNHNERAALQRWEGANLSVGGVSTSDWPGWPTIYRRRYSQ
ncbi:MAG: hypothetical protein V4857_07950 [Pseudomonadota bacterium]